MTYEEWLDELQIDAWKTHCKHRMFGTQSAWRHIYNQGVSPSIQAISEWCLEDPTRFIELRTTELSRAA